MGGKFEKKRPESNNKWRQSIKEEKKKAPTNEERKERRIPTFVTYSAKLPDLFFFVPAVTRKIRSVSFFFNTRRIRSDNVLEWFV